MQLGVEGWVTYRQSRGEAHALVGDGADLTLYAGEALLECFDRFAWILNERVEFDGGHLLRLIPLEVSMKMLAKLFPSAPI